MSVRRRLSALGLLFFAATGGAACSSSTTFVGECLKNDDCTTGFYCKRTRIDQGGICACRSDEACAKGEVCNPQGVCQARAKCRSNAECDPSKFCDVASGACIDRTACGTDVHCIPGTVCNLRASPAHCIDGCFSTADCPLYSVCDRTGLTSSVAVGRCIAGRCSDKTFCPFGSRCVNSICMRDPNPNHCAACDPRSATACGSPRNYCLVNAKYDPMNPRTGTPNYCGVECRAEDDCPHGYNCTGVVLLTQNQCGSNAECGGNGRICIFGEGDLRGRCTCAADADCTVGGMPRCAFGGRCIGSGRPCSTDPECAIRCVQGGCLLGAACGPLDGVSCPDIQ